jgi:steroid delta-isomerase-like uncharacterized protein
MSPTDIVRDYTECWNRRDWERARSLMHPQYSYTGADGQEQRGQEAGLAVGQMFATAFPDGHIDIKTLRSDGDFVTVEFTGSGTHKGELMGVPPTNKKVSLPMCEVVELRDGKIYRVREYYDTMHLMTQLGVMKAPAPASVRSR